MRGLKRREITSVPQTQDAMERALQQEEESRATSCVVRRMYAEGRQYDDRNEENAKALGCATVGDLPEHEKLLAYSTQIGECLDFLSDRLGEGFRIEAEDAAVQEVIDSVIAATEQIAAENDEGDVEVVTDDLLREAMTASDVAAYVGFDPFEQRPFIEFWESEHVEFRMSTTRVLDKVIRKETVWRQIPDSPLGNDWREVVERVEYEMAMNEAGHMEARATTYWDAEEDPQDTVWLGVGRIPWALLRADKRSLRGTRGEALVTDQVMMQADRYNAVEQNSYLISRYNSHGNLAVVGDGAELKSLTDGRVSKDVADVLTFPGGTQLIQITLPTDPQMIEHQRSVLAESMYGAFGLVRVEPDTIQGLGGVSGYALEILNQKSEATFKRIARRWRSDVISLLALCLDVHAWKTGGEIGYLDPATGTFTAAPVDTDDAVLLTMPENAVVVQQWWEVDPSEVFANRKISIKMGSGYIVDDVMIRDDFVAGLISRAEALRKRGYEPKEITDIEGEVQSEAEAAAQSAMAGMPPALGGQTPGESAPASKTKAGSTVGGSTERGA